MVSCCKTHTPCYAVRHIVIKVNFIGPPLRPISTHTVAWSNPMGEHATCRSSHLSVEPPHRITQPIKRAITGPLTGWSNSGSSLHDLWPICDRTSKQFIYFEGKLCVLWFAFWVVSDISRILCQTGMTRWSDVYYTCIYLLMTTYWRSKWFVHFESKLGVLWFAL